MATNSSTIVKEWNQNKLKVWALLVEEIFTYIKQQNHVICSGIILNLSSRCHKDKPDQLNLGLKEPNLSYGMLHEHPHRNYNNHHPTANIN